MPTQQHIDEIADYLRSFKDGTRKHNQDFWHSHCGTSHCLAGWKALDDATNAGIEIKDWNEGYEETSFSDTLLEWLRSQVSHSTFLTEEEIYARIQWQLDPLETGMLFEAALTLEQMMNNLCDIAKNHGLVPPNF